MTQREMIAELSFMTGLSKYRIRKILNNLTSIIIKELSMGDKISIAGIGKLLVVDTKARDCINPKTLEKISVKANRRVKFKVSSTLKKNIRI